MENNERAALFREAMDIIHTIAKGGGEVKEGDRLRAADLMLKYAAREDEGDGAPIVLKFRDDYGKKTKV